MSPQIRMENSECNRHGGNSPEEEQMPGAVGRPVEEGTL